MAIGYRHYLLPPHSRLQKLHMHEFETRGISAARLLPRLPSPYGATLGIHDPLLVSMIHSWSTCDCRFLPFLLW